MNGFAEHPLNEAAPRLAALTRRRIYGGQQRGRHCDGGLTDFVRRALPVGSHFVTTNINCPAAPPTQVNANKGESIDLGDPSPGMASPLK